MPFAVVSLSRVIFLSLLAPARVGRGGFGDGKRSPAVGDGERQEGDTREYLAGDTLHTAVPLTKTIWDDLVVFHGSLPRFHCSCAVLFYTRGRDLLVMFYSLTFGGVWCFLHVCGVAVAMVTASEETTPTRSVRFASCDPLRPLSPHSKAPSFLPTFFFFLSFFSGER